MSAMELFCGHNCYQLMALVEMSCQFLCISSLMPQLAFNVTFDNFLYLSGFSQGVGFLCFSKQNFGDSCCGSLEADGVLNVSSTQWPILKIVAQICSVLFDLDCNSCFLGLLNVHLIWSTDLYDFSL